MERHEVIGLMRAVNATWPNAKPAAELAEPAWFEDLADVPLADGLAAFTAWRRQGRSFPPTCGELRALALELRQPTPRFELAWAAIAAAISRHGYYCGPDALADLQSVPLAPELVVAMGGWRAICRGGDDDAPATNPGVWRSQAEHAWRALVEERRTDRAVADLAAPLPAVEQARQRRDGAPDPLLPPMPIALALPPLPAPPRPGQREDLAGGGPCAS